MGDNVRSQEWSVIDWRLPPGERLCSGGSADPTGTAERELFDVKLGQSR